MTTITGQDASVSPNADSSFGLRAWAYRPGWAQVSLLLLLAVPAFVLGAVSAGIYGATVCTMVWLALRMADEDAAWVERERIGQPSRHRRVR